MEEESSSNSPGILWGIGVGPGDPGLLTYQALRILDTTKIVVYPVAFNGISLARQIVAAILNDHHTEIALRLCFNSNYTLVRAAYQQIASAIALYLLSGQDVAVLCEGDPLFFGSFSHITTRMDNRFSVRAVPGVNSLSACSSVTLNPLALANEQVVIIPALRSTKEITKTILLAEVCAIVKIGQRLEAVISILNQLGLLEKAWYVEHASQLEQVVYPLTFIMRKKVAPYFSTILVYKRKNDCNIQSTDFSS